jgi:hypothetical protein
MFTRIEKTKNYLLICLAGILLVMAGAIIGAITS